MRIILSPAKKMNIDPDSLDTLGLPLFLDRAERLHAALRSMDSGALRALWRCSDAIAERSFRQLWEQEPREGQTPAILAYEGLQYRTMAPGVLTDRALGYLGERLRILSGLYGMLRPFDAVVPYRLEMQAMLAVDGHRDLYGYWGDRLADRLRRESDVILNLASREYSSAVSAHLPPGVRFLTCTFGELKEGRILQKGTRCKMARGQMVRWLAENEVARPEDIRQFDGLGYRFCAERSTEDNVVFLKAADPPR